MPSVTTLSGVGPRVAERLARLGIDRVQDLLFHLPIRYQDRTRVIPMGSLRPADEVVVEGVVMHAEVAFRRRRSLLVRIADGSGQITLRFFHFNATQQQNLCRGARVRCFGETRRGPSSLEMVHPEYRVIQSDEPDGVEEHLTPIYSTTEGVHQIGLRKLTSQALQWLSSHHDELSELIPDDYFPGASFPALADALQYIHRPPPDADIGQLTEVRHPAQRRLVFEELLAQQLSLVRLRARLRKQSAPVIRVADKLLDSFMQALPFELTGAQQRVIEQLRDDIRQAHPMLRLVQGDVGSGKTVVAAAACLKVVEAGLQAALMAPTEILAEQHYRSFAGWLEPLGLKVAWLSGKLKAAQRREMLEMIASGDANVIVGTHALFQDDVTFKSLALVVIDEQHRFGVHQRLALREKGVRDGRYPHQLIMTATPIPRTLAMTAYADLDYSVVDELPPGRTPVKTVAIADNRRAEVVERVSRACGQGRQAYWVCTLIDESEALQCQAAEDAYASLTEALPHLAVGLVHGRMKPQDKEEVMQRFTQAGIDLLVATTVIEVGVDVPNASLMIIENAERLGLAQLHQLRGRVGRGNTESSCVLMYRTPLTANAKQRIDAMRKTTDGFEIARIDLELRGPGEVLGTRQTGLMQLQIADIVRDQELLPRIQETAKRLLAEHPECVEPLIQRWLGDAVQFGQV